jgi:hypothetical protein
MNVMEKMNKMWVVSKNQIPIIIPLVHVPSRYTTKIPCGFSMPSYINSDKRSMKIFTPLIIYKMIN